MRAVSKLTTLQTWCLMGIASLLLLLVFLANSVAQQPQSNLLDGPEPLPVEQVFVPQLDSVDEQSIAVSFTIEEGYYLYRDKLAFSVADSVTGSSADASEPSAQREKPTEVKLSDIDPIALGTPLFAESTILEDEFFGEQAIFRNTTVINIPYSTSGELDSLTLGIRYQGCADIGLCYPPTDTTLAIDLPASATSRKLPESSATTPLQAEISTSNQRASSPVTFASEKPLDDMLGTADISTELLAPEMAYLPQITAASAYAIDLNWFIEEGYYLYRDKFSFSLEHPDGLQSGETLISEGVEQHDEFFGNVMVLRDSADARITLANPDPGNAEALAGTEGMLTIYYQGCADVGVCFPPAQTTLPVNFSGQLPAQAIGGLKPVGSPAGSGPPTSNPASSTSTSSSQVSAPDSTAGSAATAASASTDIPVQSEQDRLFDFLGASSLWLTVATFFGLGLLLAFTPCVLPMVPILSSLIVGQGKSMTTGRAFQLSLVYVLVMAGTYAAVGVVVGLSGYNVQPFLQSPTVLSGIAVLFVLLALSMFGFYELQMPASLQTRLTQWSNRQGSGQVSGVAAMGFISTLIVGPCVTAPLAGALIYIAKTGDALIGGTALFALGLGMGAPLLLIGTSAGKFVPSAGAWMDTTKQFFGILMLGMAIYMISRFLPVTATMTLYGVLAVMSGVYLGATDSITRDTSGWRRFGKGAGLVVAVYGLALLIGALAGGGSYSAPLKALSGGSVAATGQTVQSEHSLPFQRVKSVQDLQNVVAQAKAEGRPVMLDFYADWCISCKEMDAFTFSDGEVQKLLDTAIVVQADVTANDAEDQAMLKEFELFGPPGIIFYDDSGEELRAARVVGFMNADKFSSHIRRFISSTDS